VLSRCGSGVLMTRLWFTAIYIQFTMETESDSAIPFLEVLVIKEGTTLTSKV
jgi:hypothetical protein